MSEIFVKIDDKFSKPHNGKLITKIEVSPNEKYFVTYSEEDHSIVGWNIDDINEGQLKSDCHIRIPNDNIRQIYISDDKKLAYIEFGHLEIYDMMNNHKIKIDCDIGEYYSYCTFNLKSELILYSGNDDYNLVLVYSTQTKNNEWKCQRIHKMPKDFDLISISKYDKIYLFSNNSIFEWNLINEKGIKIFGTDEEMKYYTPELRISSNEKFICTRIKDKVFIYSVELEIPIVSLNINNDIQLYDIIYRTGLIHLLLPLLLPLLSNSKIRNSIMEHCWKECLNRLNKNDQEFQIENLLKNIQFTTKYALIILDGYIWKIKLEENASNMNFIFENSEDDDSNEYWYFDNESYETYENLNIHLFNPYMDNIHALFQKVISNFIMKRELTLIQGLIKWEINNINDSGIELQIFSYVDFNKWDLICKRVENFSIFVNIFLLGIELFDNDDIVLITTIGLFIYHLNKNNKSITLRYFYHMKSYYMRDLLHYYRKIFSKSILPLSNCSSFEISDGWVLDVKNNKESLLKYGVELLSFAIKDQRLKLIDDIYKKCINYFEQDLRNNRMFLSIITSTMPLLNEYFPDYVSRYSLEILMITDYHFYDIKYQHSKLHLDSFQYPQILNLTNSILWLKYNMWIGKLSETHLILFIVIQLLSLFIILIFLPIYFVMFYILSKYLYINDFYTNGALSLYFEIIKLFSKRKTTPVITFMIPYINFVNYPKDYNWFWELISPQPSPFVNTISNDIYKTLDGEALINFKWNMYGKIYHSIIWIGFMALLGCFNAAAKIPKQYIGDDVLNHLLIASIILGFIHLSFEVRQLIYKPERWMKDIGNWFGI
ncbi:hypothetical protein RirG_145060 [Rhizophagus irregularis DAOM 197198w]|uniref:Ion transport domain-containing protein n=1 Tax=Rhizophagus irregularis (strain DAOM 197198w) TaxID=1432141 RepID=A0A015K9T9_RHIIW|nr:hypothetical protein RirG_145060 [Rhizophagus irregularis DAOM 197198w]